MLVTLPCVLLLLDYWPLNRLRRETCGRLVLEKLPMVPLVIGAAVITVMAQSRGAIAKESRFPPEMRLANAALATTAYLRQTFWPFDLGAFYPHTRAHLSEPRVWCAMGFLLLLTGLAVWSRRRFPWFTMGWLWFLGTLVPVVDLGRLLGGAALRPGPHARIAVAEVDGIAIGLAVDAAIQILAVEGAALGDPPALAMHSGRATTRALLRRPDAAPIAVLSLEHVVESLYREALAGGEALR